MVCCAIGCASKVDALQLRGVRTSFWMDYEAAVSSHLIQVGPDRDVLSDDYARIVGDDTCKML